MAIQRSKIPRLKTIHNSSKYDTSCRDYTKASTETEENVRNNFQALSKALDKRGGTSYIPVPISISKHGKETGENKFTFLNKERGSSISTESFSTSTSPSTIIFSPAKELESPLTSSSLATSQISSQDSSTPNKEEEEEEEGEGNNQKKSSLLPLLPKPINQIPSEESPTPLLYHTSQTKTIYENPYTKYLNLFPAPPIVHHASKHLADMDPLISTPSPSSVLKSEYVTRIGMETVKKGMDEEIGMEMKPLPRPVLKEVCAGSIWAKWMERCSAIGEGKGEGVWQVGKLDRW